MFADKEDLFAKSKHPYQWDPWINIAKLLTHLSLNRPYRPCGSTSFLPLMTSSVLTVKANFVR